MTRNATIPVFAIILLLGGCQYEGTNDLSNLLKPGESILISKEKNGDSSDPEPKIAEEKNYYLVDDLFFNWTTGPNDLVLTSVEEYHLKDKSMSVTYESYAADSTRLSFNDPSDSYKFSIYGTKGHTEFQSLPNGTVAYTGVQIFYHDDELQEIDFYADMNFDNSLITLGIEREDGLYYHGSLGDDSPYTRFDIETGRFEINYSGINPPSKPVFKIPSTGGVPWVNRIIGHIHPENLSGVFYQGPVKGAFIASQVD